LPFPKLTSLEGKVLIVTGASDGIGARLAVLLRKRGAQLVLTARDEAKMRAAASSGDLVIAGDLTQEETRAAVIGRAVERFGRIDVLINNAGRGSYYSPSAAPLDDARSLFELNFFAPLHLAQLATPFLCRGNGMLVNVASIAGQVSLPWLPVYSASKFALASLSTSQRIELRKHGVAVMAVFPGYVDTDFHAHATGTDPPELLVKAKRFAIGAEQCAEAIVRGIERRRSVVVTPGIGWAAIWMNRLFPSWIESRLAESCTSS
jgi:short-subunit dehydrogenase